MTDVMTPSNTITAGQIAKLQDRFAARLRKSNLRGDLVQQVIEAHGDAIADEMVVALRNRVEAMLVLVPREPFAITISRERDPDKYFRDREGLWVWGGMRELVVANSNAAEVGAKFDLAVADLGKDVTDTRIEAALPKDHLFDESAVCAIIAEMIDVQPGGVAGALLNNGYANLFYTRSCVVRVRWYGAHREWRVNAWRRDGVGGWDAGRRVFSPAN